MQSPSSQPAHLVGVIGGATAGAEIAGRLAARGVQVVVFEQNPRPYGKIEDGLPRWHVALRRKEYEVIGGKLEHPNVHFVPLTKVGRDVAFDDLVRGWGFHAVVLACGAWRDRPLPIEGADTWIDKGLVYQNPFVIWFNHAQEAAYHGPRYVPQDDALVVGGGLASIDVVKILMLETARAALTERGVDASMLELEVKGIPKVLAAHGLVWEDLELAGCTLFYRRRIEDMPLVEMPAGVPAARQEKVRTARRKLLEKAQEKYRFRVESLAAPDGLVIEDDRLVGLRFRRTRIEDGRLTPTDDTFERRGSVVVSSIGSIPEALPGIELKGELFRFTDWDLGRLEGYPTVFSAGNVVTGKGNIVASRKHATAVSEHVIEQFLGLGDAGRNGEDALLDRELENAARVADAVAEATVAAPRHPPDALERHLARARQRQHAVGYPGDYRAWIERVTPPDLE